MIGPPNRDRQAERRESTRLEILATAWEIAHESGQTSVTLREIAARIGMQPPSLFPADLRARLRALATTYFDFAAGDLERHQLMDMPMLRDFTPSEEACQPAVECYGVMQSVMTEIGLRDQADLDMYTALVGGFVNQQLANDPQGNRWRVLLPRAITMLAGNPGLARPG